MLKFIKRLISQVSILLLPVGTLFSQTQVLINKDTNVCFTAEQNRYVQHEVIRARETKRLYDACEQRAKYLDRAYMKDSLGIIELKKSNRNIQEQFDNKSFQYEECDDQRKELQKEINKQKAYKWLGFASATAIAALEVYFEIRRGILKR